MVNFTVYRDDSVIDDYFATSRNKIYIGTVTLAEYNNIVIGRRPVDPAQIQSESISQYMALPWQKLNNIPGLYTMHKACVVGSDIYRNGILAPQQMQWATQWPDHKLVAHPGSDRMLYIAPLIQQGLIEDKIYMQIEEQSWMKDTLRVLPPYNIKRIESKEELKEYYKNWNDSQYYNVPWDIPEEEAGFMRMFKKNICNYLKDDRVLEADINKIKNHKTYKNGTLIRLAIGMEDPEASWGGFESLIPHGTRHLEIRCDNLIPHGTRHLELKALQFRVELGDTLQRFYKCADTVNLEFGPWSLSHQALVFDPEKAW